MKNRNFAALFALLACAGAAAAESADFVNVQGVAPRVLSAQPELDAHAGIERLLTRPSDLWERLRQGFALGEVDPRLVAQHEAWYASRPELLRAIFGRGRRYLHYIIEQVEKRGLPAEIALLPAVESGFNPRALSSANASGLWQFIPDTGTRFRLTQTPEFDARRDVRASTGAALDYLEELFRLHKDWHLALASYNWGENAVLRAVGQAKSRGRDGTFDSLSLPEETRNYVPRLLALRNIVADPDKYGLDLGHLEDEPFFTTLPLDFDLDLRVAARLADLSYEDLLALNPGYSRPVAGGLGHRLVVPVESAEALREALGKYREEQQEAAKARPRRR